MWQGAGNGRHIAQPVRNEECPQARLQVVLLLCEQGVKRALEPSFVHGSSLFGALRPACILMVRQNFWYMMLGVQVWPPWCNRDVSPVLA